MSTEILSTDIQVRASERMTDADDGGGEMSSLQIEDNKINQLFDPISDSDRVAGRISLRQAYLHVHTPSDAKYLGANIILSKPPDDPAVNCLLFKLAQSGADRLQAKSTIESYLVIGPRSRMHPVGTQRAGQAQILAYQKTGGVLPEIGDVYVLSIESGEGVGTTHAFKIKAVESSQETYTYTDGTGTKDFTCTSILMTMTQPLDVDFPGVDPHPTFPGTTWIRRTTVSAESRYYGISKLSQPAATNDVSVTVDNLLQQIVPTVASENPVLDVPVSVLTYQVDAGSHTVDVSDASFTSAVTVTVGNKGLVWTQTLRPIPLPGTTIVSYRNNGKWYTLEDNGSGGLSGASQEYGSGILNYANGVASVTLGSDPDIGSAIIWQWGSNVDYSKNLTITSSLMNQDLLLLSSRTSYVVASSLVIKYKISNVEYTATTNSSGVISGPDVTGNIVRKWVDNTYKTYAAVNWINLPDVSSQITLEFDTGIPEDVEITPIYPVTWNNGTAEFTLASAPITPKTVLIIWAVSTTHSTQRFYLAATDDGNGALTATIQGSTTSFSVGTVNYVTGEVSLTADFTRPYSVYNAAAGTWTTINVPFTHFMLTTTAIMVCSYVPTVNVSTQSNTATLTLPSSFTLQLAPEASQRDIVPESLRFTWGSQEYRDMNGDGKLYRNTYPWPGTSGTLAGTINYTTREVIITSAPTYTTSPISVKSCLTRYGAHPVTEYSGRVSSSDIKPGSFYVRATSVAGTLYEATSDQNGLIDSEEIHGTVNQEMGIVYLEFGKLVLDTSLSEAQKLEPWYDADNIDQNGYIWRPMPMITDTVKMTCVVQTTLPLSPSELGLDPVRLPLSGKVPIIAPGSRMVVHHTDSLQLPNPAIAGSTIDCGRTRVARVRLVDAIGRRVPDDRFYTGEYVLFSSLTPVEQQQYEWWEIREDGTVWKKSTMDLDAGLVELSDPLDLTGFTQPLTLEHTIEDSALVLTTDLSGLITFNRKLTHDYTTDAYVSSQLYLGDMWARYTNLFSQFSWTGTWSNSLIGSNTSGQYNDVLYPIEVTNRGVIDERWRLTFTSTTEFVVIGERVGQVGMGNINDNCAITNIATGAPYFVIDARGWGTGWSVGNTVRFNTVWPGAFWVLRCTNPSMPTGNADTVGITFRGDSAPLA